MRNKTAQVNFWHLSKEEAFQQLHTGQNGIDEHDVARLRQQYGPNTIKANGSSSAFLLFLSQFKSPITLMLIAAALLSAGLGDVADTLIILAIVLISSFLGFWQEKGASDAVKELMKMVQLHCAILRGGKKREIPIEDVVPGDVVILSAGDVIPGDNLILESQELFVDEAAFTGET